MRLRTLLALLLVFVLAGCSGETTPTLQSEAVSAENADAAGDEATGTTAAVERTPPPVLASGDDATFATALNSIAAYGTGRYEAHIELVEEALGSSDVAALEIEGVYDTTIAASELKVDMETLVANADAAQIPGMEAYFGEPLTAISIDDEVWIQWELLSVLTGTPDAWITTDVTDAAASAELGIMSGFGDPTAALDELATADVVVEDLGDEVVRGATVRHWSTTVDLDELGSQFSLAGRADLDTAFGSLHPQGVTVELWVGDADGLLHRYQMTELASEGGSTIRIDFLDHGLPVTIERPPADAVVDGAMLWG